jgi:hypothetical protein
MAGEASGKNRTEGVSKINLFSDSGPINAAMGRPAPPEAAQLQRLNQAPSATADSSAVRRLAGDTQAVYGTNQTDPGAGFTQAQKPAWASGGGTKPTPTPAGAP